MGIDAVGKPGLPPLGPAGGDRDVEPAAPGFSVRASVASSVETSDALQALQRGELGLDAYIVPRTHDNVLWQTYDLKPGQHTLRIVVTGKSDQRSKGKQVAIQQAVVYRAPD